MSSRAEKKAQLKQERQQRDQQQATVDARRKRIYLLGGLVAVAAVVVVVLVVVSQGGNSGNGSNVAGAKAIERSLRGIPQSGNTLGRPNAPVTVLEFADMQCPACRVFSLNTLPQVVKQYVRSGKIKIELELLQFVGPDSSPAAKASMAAGAQSLMWQYAELMYKNQGQENTGYVSDSYLKNLAQKVPGLNVSKWQTERKNPSYQNTLQQNTKVFQEAGGQSTPSFILRGPTGKKKLVEGAIDLNQFGSAVDSVSQNSE